MPNLTIKLTPVDTYFFGGEKTREDNGELVMDYFVSSNDYPQQTTLLGVLRYLLLLMNNEVFDGKRITDRDQAAILIGPESFQYAGGIQKFGKIKELSPLFFNDGKQDWYFGPRDVEFNMDENFQLIRDTKPYNAKDHSKFINLYLINSNGDKKLLSEIVSERKQVGNEKSESGESRDEKFYKMTYKTLSVGWSFCVNAEIDEGAGISIDESIFLPFGGERSFFRLDTVKHSDFTPRLVNYQRDCPYILCLSDCFVDGGILTKAVFTVNEFTSFRNLQSKVKHTTKYSSLSHVKDIQKLNRSSRYNLMQRGSVLYFRSRKDRDVASEMITTNQENCRNIGLNQIFTN